MINPDTDGVDQHDNTGENGDHNTGAGAIFAAPAGDSAFDPAEIQDSGSNHKYNAESDQYPAVKS